MAVPVKADLNAMFNLAPKDAIAYLENKGHQITWDWHDVDASTHARAFTVAKGMRLDIQQDIHKALVDNLKAGESLEDFQEKLEPILRSKGWWGKKFITNSDGDSELVQLGSPHRLKTIYQTNMQSAYMAGRYNAALQATDTHPYWMYIAVNDGRTRPSHAALHGKVFRWDDPIWQTIMPPNGFNCRCRFIALTEREVKRRGLVVESSEGKLTSKEVEMGVSKRTGEVRTTRVSVLQTTDRTGKPITFSPDPGFNGGPQQSHLLDSQVFEKAKRTLPVQPAEPEVIKRTDGVLPTPGGVPQIADQAVKPTTPDANRGRQQRNPQGTQRTRRSQPQLSSPASAEAIAEMQTLLLSEPRQQAWEAFVDNARRFEVYIPKRAAAKVVDQNKTIGIGVLGTAELAALESVGVQPHSGVVFMRDSLLVGPKAVRHENAGNALTVAEWKRLPQMLANPNQVLRQSDNNNIVYVIDAGEGMVIKVAVRADRKAHAKLGLDDVATAFKVKAEDIEGGIVEGLYVQIR